MLDKPRRAKVHLKGAPSAGEQTDHKQHGEEQSMFCTLFCYPNIDTSPEDAISFEDTNDDWTDVLANPEVGDKMGPAVSVAHYLPETKVRNKSRAVYAHALVFDVDIWDNRAPFTLEEIKKNLDGVRFIAWTTYSSNKECYKWRVIVPLATEIPASLYSSLWLTVNETWLENCGAEVTRDITRFGFLPRLPNENARKDYLWHISAGDRFDWRPYEELLEEELVANSEVKAGLSTDFIKPAYWITNKVAVKKAKIYFKDVHKQVDEGSRHQALFKAACRLWWDFALEEEEVREVLNYINKRFATPKDQKDVEKEIVEGYKRTLGEGAVPQPDPYGNKRNPSKVITRDDLRELAHSYRRRSSDMYRVAGSRLKLLVAGEAISEPHDCHAAFFELADVLAREYREEDPKRLVKFFIPSLLIMSKISEQCPSEEDLIGRIKFIHERVERDRTEQEKAKEDALRIRISQAFRGKRDTPYTEDEIRKFEKDGFTHSSWIVQNGSNYFIFLNGDYVGPFNRDSLLPACTQFLAPAYEYVKLKTFSDKGVPRQKNRDELMDEYGVIASYSNIDLSQSKSFYDEDNDTFVEAPLRQRNIEPAFIDEIDLWLKALAGDKFETLCDWLASVTYIDRPSSALYIEGPPGCGKSLLANGIARIWTVGGPTSLVDILRWNDDLTQCPIVFADEVLPDEWIKLNSTGQFRQIIQDTRRPLRKRYRSNGVMHGAIRLILAANNANLLNTSESLSKNDIQAIQERLFFIQADQKATDYLNSKGGFPYARRFVEEDLIAKHVLWLTENREVSPQGRFIVAGDGEYLSTSLATGSGRNEEICSFLFKFLKSPWIPTKPSDSFVFIKNGVLYARAEGITQHWENYMPGVKPLSMVKVGKALKSLSPNDVAKGVRFSDNEQRKLWEIDQKFMVSWCDSAGIDIEEYKRTFDMYELKCKVATWAEQGYGT